jgi:hypothetical protein
LVTCHRRSGNELLSTTFWSGHTGLTHTKEPLKKPERFTSIQRDIVGTLEYLPGLIAQIVFQAANYRFFARRDGNFAPAVFRWQSLQNSRRMYEENVCAK